MSQVFVGTAYHQVYCVPLDLRAPIVKLGEKKKCPVVNICMPKLQGMMIGEVFTMQELTSIVTYADPTQSFRINRQQDNSIELAETLPITATESERIISYQIFDGNRTYFTNHGNTYESRVNEEKEGEANWCKLYYNDIYANAIKSLPPQRAGKQLPEYTRASVYSRGDKTQVGFVGRGVLPFVFEADREMSSIVWRAKNVTNDELDLQVPHNDIDLCFMNMGCNLAAANADNKIRIYDVKGRRRRPVTDVALTQIAKVDKVNLTKMAKSDNQFYLYVGNHKGSIYELDVRKNLLVSNKFKGITTTIKDMQVHEQKLAVISLDGYLRIFNTVSREKQFERYLNTQPEVLRMGAHGIVYPEQDPYNVEEIDLQNDEENEAKKVHKVKKIRKRNKVGLKYLEGSKFEDVKLEQKNEQDAQIKEEGVAKHQYEDEDLDL